MMKPIREDLADGEDRRVACETQAQSCLSCHEDVTGAVLFMGR